MPRVRDRGSGLPCWPSDADRRLLGPLSAVTDDGATARDRRSLVFHKTCDSWWLHALLGPSSSPDSHRIQARRVL